MNSNVLRILALMITFSLCIGDEKLLIEEPGKDNTWEWNSTGMWSVVSWPHAYYACELETSIVDTIRTPFLKLSESPFPLKVKAVNVEVKFAVRSCSSWPKKESLCTETFGLYVVEQDQELPTPGFNNFTKLVATLRAAPGEMTNETPTDSEIESKIVIPVAVTRKGLYFALRQSNTCVAIFSFKVYYNWCPSYKGKLEFFPGVASPATGSVSVRGLCFLFAVRKLGSKTDSAFCDSRGKWTFIPSSTCVCKAGYQPVNNKCEGCPIGTYKGKHGNLNCTRCPANSSPDSKRTRCDCKTGYYRTPLEPNSANCTTIPSAPRNLSTSFINGNSVKLSWNSPLRLGGRDDVFYDINCFRLQKSSQSWGNCNKGVRYHPKSTGLKIRAVVVTNLQAHALYQFRVLARNGVSSVAKGTVNFTEVNVTTGRRVENESLTCQLCDSFSGPCITTTHTTCPGEDSAACYYGYVTSTDSNGAITVHQVKGCTKYNESNCSQQCALLEQLALTNFTKCQVTCCSGDLCNSRNDTVSTMKPTSYYTTSEVPPTTVGRNITSVATVPPVQSVNNLIVLTILIVATVILI